MKIAGCVPAYNNEATIAQAVASLQAQTISLNDIFVVDDGSTDATAQHAKEVGARVVSMGTNQGRGAARACAIEETDADLLLSVDGTNALAPDFLEKCLLWFEDPKIAAVYGRIIQQTAHTAIDRWRGRHLYRDDLIHNSCERSGLITWGLCMRTEDIKSVGNFDYSCRHGEDVELGIRLLMNNYSIIEERSAIVQSLASNSAPSCFERHARWNGLLNAEVTKRHRIKTGLFLVRQDLRDLQIARAWVSLKYLGYLAKLPTEHRFQKVKV